MLLYAIVCTFIGNNFKAVILMLSRLFLFKERKLTLPTIWQTIFLNRL